MPSVSVGFLPNEQLPEFLVRWRSSMFQTEEGEVVELVSPVVLRDNRELQNSHVRSTPPLLGLHLIQAIEDADIISWHELHGRGRVSLPNATEDGSENEVGRFGLKAEHATVRSFVSEALKLELGVSAEVLGARRLKALALYSGELGVPVRDDLNEHEGERLFHSFGCGTCHRPSYQVRRIVAGQSDTMTIWPFTDLLLHDLGYGESTKEMQELWRTAPLWGISHTNQVVGYLHDGRARSLREAILWHGGDASGERANFVRASQNDQEQLLNFLNSL